METKRMTLLDLLDSERQTVVYPGVFRFSDEAVVRDVSADGKMGEIVYSSCTEAEIDRVIERQVRAARSAGYELEWKVFGHDKPPCLGERLLAAGFEAGDKELFMVLRADADALVRFGAQQGEIRRVTTEEGLKDYRTIREEVSGKDCGSEIARYIPMLRDHPDSMSIYVAYVDREPAACGRVYFHPDSQLAGLYGGNTREKFRRRGLFTQIVAARIREAMRRGITSFCVDALPTSEPILRKRGFQDVTYTQPFSLPQLAPPPPILFLTLP